MERDSAFAAEIKKNAPTHEQRAIEFIFLPHEHGCSRPIPGKGADGSIRPAGQISLDVAQHSNVRRIRSACFSPKQATC
jgi:hypothetical protein